MKQTIVPVTIPYTVEFIRRRCRTVQSLVVWDEQSVAICEVSDRETSIAYSIGLHGSSGPAYDIRSFRGKTWWPLFDRSQALSVGAFIASIDDPSGCFLATSNFSPSTLHSPRDITSERFEADITIGRELASSRDQRRALAHRLASRLLFCNGFVYQEGGEPAYFGTQFDNANGTKLSLRIGGLGVGCNQPGDRWHLGLSASQRRRAAHRSFVFHIDEIDAACLALKMDGFRPVIEQEATITGSAAPGIDAAVYCADAVARAMLRPSARMPEDYQTAMMTFSAHANSGGLISRELSREIITEGLVVINPADLKKNFAIEREWARKAVDRLDRRFPAPALSPEEDEMLAQLAREQCLFRKALGCPDPGGFP
jgi:hypothetical protein